jgi:hypothetical protein
MSTHSTIHPQNVVILFSSLLPFDSFYLICLFLDLFLVFHFMIGMDGCLLFFLYGRLCLVVDTFCMYYIIMQFRVKLIAGMGLTGTFPNDPTFFPPFVRNLDVSSNRLQGSLSSSTSTSTEWKYLVRFRAGENNFTGTIPATLVHSRNLMDLIIPSNQLSSSSNKTESFFLQHVNKDIKMIVVNNNQLNGSMDGLDVQHLDSMSNLRMEKNSLSSHLPPELFQLQYLSNINLDYNNLTGSIPTLIDLPFLSSFQLNSNKLTGTIPNDIYNCTFLMTLQISDNQLKGTISTNIGNLDSLLFLGVAKNQFVGTLPTELGQLVRLQTFTSIGSNFTYQVPSELCTLRQKSLNSLETDCRTLDNYIEIQCPSECCTTCCMPSGNNCQAV